MPNGARSPLKDVWRATLGAAACAALLAACGPGKAPPPGAPGGYDVEAADARSPCSLLTDAEAAEISGGAFRGATAQDRILGPQTTCGWSVGAADRPGLVQITVAHGDTGVTAAELFTLRCGETAADACTLPSGLVVRRAGDWMIEASVQDGDGRVDTARSDRLSRLVAPRLAQLRTPKPAAKDGARPGAGPAK